MPRTIVAPLFKDRMSRKMDLAILSDQSARPDEHCRVVDYPFDSALFGHSEHNVKLMFSREFLDFLDTGSGNRFGKVVHFVLHRVAGEV